MKTAMQELKESIDTECKLRGMIINWDMYLARELRQMQLTWDKAVETVQGTSLPEFNDFEDYYNRTYKP